MKRKQAEEVDDAVQTIMKRIKLMMTRKRKRDDNDDEEGCTHKRIKLCNMYNNNTNQYRRDTLVYL